MSAKFINSCNEKADTEWSLGWVTCLGLTLFGKLIDHSLNWVLTVVSVPVVQALVSHEFVNVSGISGKTGEHHAHVVIDVEDLLLMGGKIIWGHFQSNQHLYKIRDYLVNRRGIDLQHGYLTLVRVMFDLV